ncbi:MAG: polysaccharide lyase family 7 protein [Acidiferrobacterales bacterium]|nr:polysaccharide lyase family 7 protein [Acidiferrobacterales bacterium]
MKNKKNLLNKMAVISGFSLLGLVYGGSVSAQAVTISNPGFESSFSGWNDIDPSSISSVRFSGSRSAKLSGAGAQVRQSVSVSPNSSYTLSAYIRGSGRLGVDLGANDVDIDVSHGSTWRKAEVDFVTTSQTSVTIFGRYNSAEGRFDDFALTRTGGNNSGGGDTGGGGGGGNDTTLTALDRTGWNLTASNGQGSVAAAIDGNAGTRWTTQQTQRAGQQLVINLGQAQTFSRVVLDQTNSPNDYPRQYNVEVSNNGQNWTSVAAASPAQSNVLTIDFAEQTASQIRIRQLGSSPNFWWSIHELNVFGSGNNSGGGGGNTGGDPNAPLSDRSAWTLSSNRGQASLANAIDGNAGTRWTTQQTQRSGQFFTVNFNAPRSFDRVVLNQAGSPNDYPRQYNLEVSNDGQNWTSVATGTPAQTNVLTIDFAQQTANQMRIRQLGSNPSFWWSIHEINIFDANAGGGDTGGGGNTGDFGLNPNLPPWRNFDLTDWALDAPNADPEDGLSARTTDRDFAEGNLFPGSEPFFFTGSDGGMVFKSTVGGARTSANTSFPRSELREMLRRGNTSIRTTGVNANNWALGYQPVNPDIGARNGVLTATLRVNQVTSSGSSSQVGRVIIGQIHADNDEPLRLYYRKLPNNSRGSIYMAHEIRNGNDINTDIIGSRSSSASNPSNGIELGQLFSYEIINAGAVIEVIIRNGDRDGPIIGRESFNMNSLNSGYDRADEWMYFKAGAYTQNNTGNSNDFDQVTFYRLDNRH